MEQKICRICGELKNINDYVKNKNMSDEHRNECKECCKKLYWNKEKRREYNLLKEIKIDGSKVCRICNIEKSFNDYHLKRGTIDGHRHECKECVKIILRKYKDVDGFRDKQNNYLKKRYQEKREELLIDKKVYYQENREKLLEYKVEYRKNNKEKIKEWRNDNKELLAQLQSDYRNRYPHIIAWRTILHSTLKRLGTEKQDRTINLLGYSAIELKNHIENLFQPGMSWKNHGEWHIDHIYPVSKFNPNTPIYEVCSLSNLQPLWAFDNLSKNNNI